MMTGLHEWDGPPSMSVEKACPECGARMEDATLGFDSRNDFVFGWRCTNHKCGHEEAKKYP